MTNTDFYLSLETAKQLKEWGCELKAIKSYVQLKNTVTNKINWNLIDSDTYLPEIKTYFEHIPAYNILEDICVRYATQFFGERYYENKDVWKSHEYKILELMQENDKESAEQYILDHTIFNPKNK